MKTESFTNSQLFKITTFLVATLLIVTIFILGKPFLVPLAWSLLIALASIRTLDRIEHKLKLKRIFVTITFVLLVVLLIAITFFFFYKEIRMIILDMPEFTEKLAAILHDISISAKKYGITLPDHIDQNFMHAYVAAHADTFSRVASGFGQGVSKIFLISFYLFFLIYYRDNYLQYLEIREKSAQKIKAARKNFNDILDIISNFLYGLMIVTIINAVICYVVFLLIGLKFAMFFAVLVALLTLIPYLGNPVAMVIVFIFASITHDGFLIPLLAVIGVLVSNALQESIFKPVIIGDKINLNAFFIFLSVIAGGLIWGIPGMILFMPLFGIVKLLLEKNEGTAHIAILFTQLPKSIRHEFHMSVEKEISEEIEENERTKR